MGIKLPRLEEEVLTNSDGEGKTFGRDQNGRIVMHTGDGDYSNAGWIECVSEMWDASGSWSGCLGLPF
jgi:hypothetical protein